MRQCLCWIFLAIPALLPNAVHGQILTNGGFETPALSAGAFQLITPGTEPSGFAWTVLSGSVDLANLPVVPFVQYSAFEGSQALDLNGNDRGAITQTFTTTPGQGYLLTFAYADNPLEGGISSASVLVQNVSDSATLLSSLISHDTSSNSPPNADWLQYSGFFVATGTSTSLTFTSTSDSNTSSGGIVLDAVSVVTSAVPEPSAMVLSVAGGLGLALTVWRQRRRKR